MAKAASKVIEVGSLGIIKDPLGIEAGEDAAQTAANIQSQAGTDAIAFQQQALDTTRGDLEPFRQAGTESIPLLQQAINDPSDRVLNNPFFTALAEQQEQRLLGSQAARGKFGSGETDDALKRNLLLLGNQFAQQDIGNLQSLSTIGANAAARTGTAAQNTATSVSDLMTQIANAESAGVVGSANAGAAATRDLLQVSGMTAGAIL